jgi:glycosyltransferase involved in cell wall biosynthesis
LAKQFSPVIFTVSEFSKRQMIEVYDYKPEKVVVIPNGWQHFNRIKLLDENLEDKYPQIRGKEFFFSLSSLAPNKNVDWIFKIAQKHPQYEFLIAGNVQKNLQGKITEKWNKIMLHLLGIYRMQK